MSHQKHYQISEKRIYASAIVCILVFVAIHVIEGFYTQAAAGLLCCFIISFFYFRLAQTGQNNHSRLTRLTGWLSVLFMIVMTIWENTIGSTYFIFPLLLFAFMIFPRQLALGLGIFAALVTVTAATRWLFFADLYRYGLSQFFILLIGHIYALVVDRNETQLDKLANTDPLTQAYNRNELYQRIDQTLASCERYGGHSCLLMIDIDHFKTINDKYGHPTGDAILQETSRVIQNRIRTSDLLFRYGGEEFALLLPSETLHQGTQLAEALRKTIASHTFSEGIKITVSVGLTESQKGDTNKTFLKRSDTALYQAKLTRNTVVAAEKTLSAAH